MRINKNRGGGVLEGDLTPMIDMTFQLIAFFMVLINFTQSEQEQGVKLPESELAKPPEGTLDWPVTLHLRPDSTVIIGGQPVSIAGLGPYLVRERNAMDIQGKLPSEATMVIRADQFAPTGRVQELIKVCQENGFEKFALRAQQDVGN